MPTATYEFIASATGTGSSDTITLSNIPATYTDLVLVSKLKNVSGTQITAPSLRYNGDSSANYSGVRLGASAEIQDERDADYQFPIWSSDVEFSASTVHIMNYSSTAIRKSTLAISGIASSGTDLIRMFTGVWTNTAAIDSITLNNASVNFTNNSTITLYGIKAS